MGDRGARRVQRGHDVERIHPLPGLGIAVGHRLERKSAGDVDQRIELAEMRRGGGDRFPGLRGVGQVDAAKLKRVGRGRNLRRRMIDAGDPRAERQCLFRDDLPSAPSAPVTTTTLPSMLDLHLREAAALAPGAFQLQCSRIPRPNAAYAMNQFPPMDCSHGRNRRPMQTRMPISSMFRISASASDARASRNAARTIKIVAIGSSSTAGEGDLVPYPARLEQYAAGPSYAPRIAFSQARMIDVLNRGLSGQEAPSEESVALRHPTSSRSSRRW